VFLRIETVYNGGITLSSAICPIIEEEYNHGGWEKEEGLVV
jgi:hypothetical protein